MSVTPVTMFKHFMLLGISIVIKRFFPINIWKEDWGLIKLTVEIHPFPQEHFGKGIITMNYVSALENVETTYYIYLISVRAIYFCGHLKITMQQKNSNYSGT